MYPAKGASASEKLTPSGRGGAAAPSGSARASHSTAAGEKKRWEERYADQGYLFGTEPVPFLKEHIDLLPKGKALDLAMGEGRNGVYLATQGFQVTGVDIAEKGLRKAQALAQERGTTIVTEVADLESYELPAETYDVILCTYYLQRDLFPEIKKALKPGGMALVETYTVAELKHRSDLPRHYLLEPGELLRLCEGLEVICYRERDDGKKAYASILARKPRLR